MRLPRCREARAGGMLLRRADATAHGAQVGKAADLALWATSAPAELSYAMGLNLLIGSYINGAATDLNTSPAAAARAQASSHQ